MLKLFVYYVGGKAKNANIEVHDVMFACGRSFEDGFGAIKKNWFGLSDGLHVDCYAEIEYIDGFNISVCEKNNNNKLKLFFVNLGAYQSNQLAETHFYNFLIAEDISSAKKIAKQKLQNKNLSEYQELHLIHTDRIAEIDNVLDVNGLVCSQYSILLTPTETTKDIKYNHGYFLI